MSVLNVAVILIAAGLALNLLLTTGLIRRVREIATKPDRGTQLRLPAAPGLSSGDLVPEFASTTVFGKTITNRALYGSPWVIGFFSSGCRACREHILDYGDYLAGLRSSSGAGLVVVVGTDERGKDLVATGQRLTDLLIVEDLGGALSDSFAVQAFPSFFAVDAEGRVSHADLSARNLPAQLARTGSG
jgi:peroxiredoxin